MAAGSIVVPTSGWLPLRNTSVSGRAFLSALKKRLAVSRLAPAPARGTLGPLRRGADPVTR